MIQPLRTVQINFDIECLKVNKKQLRAVLGYLITWGSNYPVCRIEPTGCDTDFLAVYDNADGTIGYVIGAVWSEADQSYSTHS